MLQVWVECFDKKKKNLISFHSLAFFRLSAASHGLPQWMDFHQLLLHNIKYLIT